MFRIMTKDISYLCRRISSHMFLQGLDEILMRDVYRRSEKTCRHGSFKIFHHGFSCSVNGVAGKSGHDIQGNGASEEMQVPFLRFFLPCVRSWEYRRFHELFSFNNNVWFCSRKNAIKCQRKMQESGRYVSGFAVLVSVSDFRLFFVYANVLLVREQIVTSPFHKLPWSVIR